MADPVKPYPLSLFPAQQARIREMLEQADEVRDSAPKRAEFLINKARDEANALRATIWGIS